MATGQGRGPEGRGSRWGLRLILPARAKALYDRMAKERQKRKPANSVPANLPEQNPALGDARDQAGQAFGVSGKTVEAARSSRFLLPLDGGRPRQGPV